MNYETLQSAMEVSSHGTDDCSRRASGVLAVMDKLSTYFGLKLCFLIFSMIEQLSITLQSINTTVNDCFYSVDLCIRALERNPTDENFHSFFHSVREEEANKCDPPILPRRRQLPRRIDGGAPQHVFATAEDLYRKKYFEAIDCVKGELKRCCGQESFLFIRNIEAMLISSANGMPCTLPSRFKDI